MAFLCGYCNEEIMLGNPYQYVMGCGHRYHAACMTRWMWNFERQIKCGQCSYLVPEALNPWLVEWSNEVCLALNIELSTQTIPKIDNPNTCWGYITDQLPKKQQPQQPQ